MTIKGWLFDEFNINDRGEADYIFEIKIKRDCSNKLLTLLQEHYIQKILERFNMVNYKPVDTIMPKDKLLSKKMCPKS